jgi:hypothetical protein
VAAGPLIPQSSRHERLLATKDENGTPDGGRQTTGDREDTWGVETF